MSYPIIWKGAAAGNFAPGRNDILPAWLVHHRMVGYLNGTDRHFASYNPSHPVSTHFGIGHRGAGGPVEISQYVALDDTAFGNGNNVDELGRRVASRWNTLGFPSQPNRRTISIEHEDGGTIGRGVVTPDIIAASIWLDSVLLSGDPARVRAAGIRFRSATVVEALARIPIDETHIVDHHFIAGPLKPYCWQRWLNDLGFPQAHYLTELSALGTPPEVDMPGENYSPDPLLGTVTVAITGRSYRNPATKVWFPVKAVPTTFGVAGSGTAPDKDDIPPSLRSEPIWIINVGGTDCWIRKADTGPLVAAAADCATAVKNAVAPVQKSLDAANLQIAQAVTVLGGTIP